MPAWRYKAPTAWLKGRNTPAQGDGMTVQFERAVPIFRIFSLDKAREFYLDLLGFKIAWEHRFEPPAPVYMQISRDGLVIHLSEHHGDGTPGSIAYVYTAGVRDLHRE
jgi:catechol 2,3-dioxygenase-like lactoylglutathione lyase family enzyme